MFGWLKRKRVNERETFINTLVAMQTMMAKQTEVMDRFLKQYEVTAEPEVKIMDETQEWKLEQERREAQKIQMPSPNFWKTIGSN